MPWRTGTLAHSSALQIYPKRVNTIRGNRLLINLGCGRCYHSAWINLDLHPCAPEVRAWSVSEGVPASDRCARACYASHLIEHLPPEAALSLLKECYRVLEVGGVVRVVVPDLEVIARNYLRSLENMVSGEGAEDEYNWCTLELLDQLVRERSGGVVASFLSEGARAGRLGLVEKRWGAEARELIHAAGANAQKPRNAIRRWIGLARSKWVEMLSGIDLEALAVARFLQSGERHRWMYDRFSLERLLEHAGFRQTRVCSASESRLENWVGFELDADLSGKVRKPDSLFMEGVKP